ncbi:MAG: SAM-dependent chlorinase/fluorinase [Chloroflexi bacterium]|nr:SAM-dependent chlorinase/fluorinase [Chloroflexota bacterium]
MRPVITLTTDFGLTDAYVAAMKGVILSINPEVVLVDVCHTIQPQDIMQAGFVLSTACSFFPERTIHVVVVDPGVGSTRKAIILRTPSADFVAPDNGVLSYVLEAGGVSAEGILPPGWRAVELTKPGFWRTAVSDTFHGRDIFAPVAGWLSLGLTPEDFGEIISTVTVVPVTHPHRERDGSMVGHIIHIDSFGNLVVDIRSGDLSRLIGIVIEVGGRAISDVSRTYAEDEACPELTEGELLALVGSSDRLEISVKGGSAAAFLKAKIGDELRVRESGGANNELSGL